MKKLELSIPSAIVEMEDNESIVLFKVKVLKKGGGFLREVDMKVSEWTSRCLESSTPEVKTDG